MPPLSNAGGWGASTLRSRLGHSCSGCVIEPSPSASFPYLVALQMWGIPPYHGAPHVQTIGPYHSPSHPLVTQDITTLGFINLVLSLPLHLLVTMISYLALYLWTLTSTLPYSPYLVMWALKRGSVSTHTAATAPPLGLRLGLGLVSMSWTVRK